MSYFLHERYVVRCIQGTFFPTETYLSRIEALVSSRNSQHSLKRFGSETFAEDLRHKAGSYEDIA